MPQGKSTIKKTAQAERPKKAKPVRGDQQKLRKGNFVIKPTIGKKAEAHQANLALTKKITARIEQTMAARASSDGGGLHIVSSDVGADGKIKPLKSAVLTKTKR